MVGAGQPEDLLAFHARLARQHVLNGVIQNMAHVQDARDVWRWYDDGIRRLGGLRVGDKTILLQPKGVPPLLNGLRFVGFGKLRHAQFTSYDFRFTRRERPRSAGFSLQQLWI